MVNVSFCELGKILPAPFVGYMLPHIPKMLAQRGEDCTALGAMWDGVACGAAVVEWDEIGGVLRSLFIDPKARGNGIAGHLTDLLLEEGARRGKEVLYANYVLKGDELAAMDAIVARRGGYLENSAPVCGMASDDFLSSPLLGPALRLGWERSKSVALFSELSQEQIDALNAEEELPPFLRPAALADRIDPLLSAAWLEDGKPVAFVSGFQSGERMFCQSTVWRGENAPEGSFRALICTQVNQCWYRSGGSFVFFISPINPRSAAMAEWFTNGHYERYGQRDALIPIVEQ